MNIEDKEIFAKNLTYYMDRDQINGVTLAKKLGISSASVSDWMNAKKMPRVDKIKKLTKIFHIEMSDLVNDNKSHKEVPLILQLYEQLSYEDKQKLIERANELIMLNMIKERR